MNSSIEASVEARISIDINPDYVRMAERRLASVSVDAKLELFITKNRQLVRKA